MEAFQEAARDLEVEGSGWTAAEAQAQLENDIAAHVRHLEQQKVPCRLYSFCSVLGHHINAKALGSGSVKPVVYGQP